jgi:hypothetical protein
MSRRLPFRLVPTIHHDDAGFGIAEKCRRKPWQRRWLALAPGDSDLLVGKEIDDGAVSAMVTSVKPI